MSGTYDCYVTLAHVHRRGRRVPGAGADSVTRVDQDGGWRSLVGPDVLSVWLVEGTVASQAKDLVLAHLAGFAPVGVTRLYRKEP